MVKPWSRFSKWCVSQWFAWVTAVIRQNHGAKLYHGNYFKHKYKSSGFWAAYERKLDKYHSVFTILLDFFPWALLLIIVRYRMLGCLGHWSVPIELSLCSVVGFQHAQSTCHQYLWNKLGLSQRTKCAAFAKLSCLLYIFELRGNGWVMMKSSFLVFFFICC